MIDLGAVWDYSDPAGSEKKLRAAADVTDGQVRAVLLTQVARALGLQGRFAEGHAVLDALVIDDSDPELHVWGLLERGRLRRSAGGAQGALPLFEQATDIAIAAGLDSLAVDALHMLAITQADPATARETGERALDLCRSSADAEAQAWEASLLNNLGMSYTETGEWDRALALFGEALAARRRTGSAAMIRTAKWMIGWTLRNLGRTEEALVIQRALAAEHAAAGTDDHYVAAELALLEQDG